MRATERGQLCHFERYMRSMSSMYSRAGASMAIPRMIFATQCPFERLDELPSAIGDYTVVIAKHFLRCR